MLVKMHEKWLHIIWTTGANLRSSGPMDSFTGLGYTNAGNIYILQENFSKFSTG